MRYIDCETESQARREGQLQLQRGYKFQSSSTKSRVFKFVVSYGLGKDANGCMDVIAYTAKVNR